VSCEARKSATRLACEAGGQSLRKLAGTGNLASLAVTIGGAADISLCIKDLTVAPSLDRLIASADLHGRATLDLGLNYVPRGIAGYFSCRFPWTEKKRIRMALPEQQAKLDAVIDLDTSTSSPTLRAAIKTSALAARIRPDPRKFFLENYNMRAVCAPAGGMLREVALDVTSSVPDMSADFTLPGEERSLVVTLEPMAFDVGGTNVVAGATYASNAKALILNAGQPIAPGN
jgi:hypothetical protein